MILDKYDNNYNFIVLIFIILTTGIIFYFTKLSNILLC